MHDEIRKFEDQNASRDIDDNMLFDKEDRQENGKGHDSHCYLVADRKF